MSAEGLALAFVDTNVIVYALAKDEPVRAGIAQRLLEQLGQAKALCTSTQVLQEAYVTLTRKGAKPLAGGEALSALDHIAAFPVVAIDYPLIREAAQLAGRASLSFWDALIVSAAVRARASRVYTEDMQHGQTIRGVTIVNPFQA